MQLRRLPSKLFISILSFISFVLWGSLVPFLSNDLQAQDLAANTDLPTSATPAHVSGDFVVPAGIAGRVEFWKLIFTRYGKDQLVFHHREYPEIIYSVLDFEELSAAYSGRIFSQMKEGEIAREFSRIDRSLAHLGGGHAPRDAFEHRLVRLFKVISEKGTAKYNDARDSKLLRTQTGIKERFRDGLVRSGRYLYAMEEVFRLAGLPTELARVPLIESSFDYTAYSSVGAAGIWQFMRATGKRYMRISAAVDERRDPIIATRAAVQYLNNAYEDLGTWPLAISSYNHGVSGILRATREVGTTDISTIIKKYKGKTFGFASSNFYPEFLAALYIERNAEKFFPGLVRESPWYFDEVKLGRATSAKEIMRAAGISLDEFERLNRAALKPVIEGRAHLPAEFMVKVPEGRGKQLIAGLGHGEYHSLHSSYNEYLEGLRGKKFKSDPEPKTRAKKPKKAAPVKKSAPKKSSTKNSKKSTSTKKK